VNVGEIDDKLSSEFIFTSISAVLARSRRVISINVRNNNIQCQTKKREKKKTKIDLHEMRFLLLLLSLLFGTITNNH
jgi:hypothetical protein